MHAAIGHILKVNWTKNGLFEKAIVFKSGTGGFACYRIPALVCTSQGTLIALCEARKHNCGDWAHSAIVARRCLDPINSLGNWEAPFVIHESKRLVEPVGLAEIMAAAAFADEKGLDQETPGFEPKVDVCTDNPVPIVDLDGKTIHLVYCEHYDSAFYTRSTDDGVTWFQPRSLDPIMSKFKVDYDWTVIASGPGHGLQLLRGPYAGRLVVPFWLASNKDNPRSHHPSQVAVIYSDDNGDTWERGDFVPFTDSSPSETQAIQLVDGRVLMNSRHVTKPGTNEPLRRILTTSPDGAHEWSSYQFDATLPEPVCLGSTIKLAPPAAGGQGIVLFSNPDSDVAQHGRQNLTVWLSQDDCRTWSWRRVIEPGAAAYSDLAVDHQNGWIYCLYEDGSIPGGLGPYNGLTIARFDVEWLMGGSGKTLKKR